MPSAVLAPPVLGSPLWVGWLPVFLRHLPAVAVLAVGEAVGVPEVEEEVAGNRHVAHIHRLYREIASSSSGVREQAPIMKAAASRRTPKNPALNKNP